MNAMPDGNVPRMTDQHPLPRTGGDGADRRTAEPAWLDGRFYRRPLPAVTSHAGVMFGGTFPQEAGRARDQDPVPHDPVRGRMRPSHTSPVA